MAVYVSFEVFPSKASLSTTGYFTGVSMSMKLPAMSASTFLLQEGDKEVEEVVGAEAE